MQDGIAGQPISMAIDRTIRRPFIGHWSVTVHRVNGGTSEIVCVSAGTGSYKTTSQVPENLTLGWWTGGDCKTLQPGFYNLITLTHIDVINILQPKSVINQSNLFEVK